MRTAFPEYDESGNPLRQLTTGLPGFAAAERTMTPDRLDRLIQVKEGSKVIENTQLDLVGNP